MKISKRKLPTRESLRKEEKPAAVEAPPVPAIAPRTISRNSSTIAGAPRKNAKKSKVLMASADAVQQTDGSFAKEAHATIASGEFPFWAHVNRSIGGADAGDEADMLRQHISMQIESDATIAAFNASLDAEERVNSYDHIVQEPPVNIDWSQSNIEICDSWFVPHRLDLVVDNRSAVTSLDRWVALWCAKPLILPRCCAALVRGPPGVGKTTSVRLALQKHGFNNIIEINASAERSKRLVQRIYALMQQYGVDESQKQRTAIVLEEVDGLSDCARAEKKVPAAAATGAKPRAVKKAATKIAPVRSAEAAVCGASNSGAEALIALLNSTGLAPLHCDARSFDPMAAPAVESESWCVFRSTVPIIMLANDCTQSFLKRISAFQVRFNSVDEESMIYRLANDLSQRLNLVWTKPSSADYFKDVPLYKVLATHASGDMRKAIMLMSEAVRAAYSRRMQLKPDNKERQNSKLIIRTQDCIAFFGHSREDVYDAPPSLFGAARFALCQAECVCARACLCKRRSTVADYRSGGIYAKKTTAPLHDLNTHIEQETIGVSGERSTVWQQLQRTAMNNQITTLPEMIFENYLLCTAEPVRINDAQCRLAAATVRRQEAMWHSVAESVRSDYAFLTNDGMRDFHAQMGTVATSLVVRYPEKYVREIPTGSVQRPAILSRFGALNLQRPAIDGENGNACGTMSKARKERNAYAEFFHLPYQQSLDAWYDWDNYVSNVGQTRGQKNMLSCVAAVAANDKTAAAAATAARKRRKATKSKKMSAVDDNAKDNDDDDDNDEQESTDGEKMPEAERAQLKIAIKQAQEMEAHRLAKETRTVGMKCLSELEAKKIFFVGVDTVDMPRTN